MRLSRLALALITLCVLVLCGCPPTPAPRRPDLATAPSILECPATMPLPVTVDVCPNKFRGKLPCARCQSFGCWDKADALYCVTTTCDDLACEERHPDVWP